MSRLSSLLNSLLNELTKLESSGNQIIIKDLFKNIFSSTNTVTQSRDEVFISAYTDYITSGSELRKLHGKYAKGERSIEETAGMVGLKLPPSKYKF